MKELVTKLRAGDLTVAEEIALGHLKLIISIAKRFRRPSSTNDIISAGIERMLECIPRFPAIAKDDNITGYIISNVKSGMSNYVENDSVVHVPGRTMRHKGKHSPGFRVVSGSVLSSEDKTSLEIDECLEKACRSDLDRVIVLLRSQGHTDPEIARKTGYRQSWIHSARLALEKRFFELWRK